MDSSEAETHVSVASGASVVSAAVATVYRRVRRLIFGKKIGREGARWTDLWTFLTVVSRVGDRKAGVMMMLMLMAVSKCKYGRRSDVR